MPWPGPAKVTEASSRGPEKAWRVVLDTNVLLSALLFDSGRLAALRHLWQQGQVVPLVCKTTVQELLRVLAYPKFRLTAHEQDQLLSDFLPYAEAVHLSDGASALPACRDPHDQMFLELAQAAGADCLVTGDGDLLALAGHPALRFAIETPAGFMDRWPKGR